MDARYTEYTENIKTVSDCMNVAVSPDSDEDEVIELVQKNAEKLFMLHTRNDRILEEVLFSKKPETLSDEDICGLLEFADSLGRRDYPITYRAYKLLHDAAVIRGDRDLIIRSCYWMSVSLYFLRIEREEIGLELFHDKIAENLLEVQKYMPDFDSIENPDTAAYLIRANANRRLIPQTINVTGDENIGNYKSYSWYQNYLTLITETVDIVTDPKKRQKFPGLPWDHYLYVTLSALTTYVSRLRDSRMNDGEYRKVAADVLKAAEYVYNADSEKCKKSGDKLPPQTEYRYYAALYHAGKLLPSKFIDILYRLYSEARPDDFTSDGIFVNLRLPLYMQYYSEFLDDAAHSEYDSKIFNARDNVSDYLMQMPRNQYVSEMTSDLRTSIWYRSANHTTYRQQVLEYILACHPPTYIHSHMVAWLSEKLFLRLCETNPDVLVGILGVENKEAVIKGKERFAKIVRQCGLYHDLGKCMIIDHIGNYSRRLTDEEFTAIKQHPLLGSDLLHSLGGFSDHAEVAYHHHRYYDGSGGYPTGKSDIPRRDRVIIDIVTVADSLEAGTDNVGRCYAATKTVDTLYQEIRRWSGTRYSPAVAALFDDPEFCKELSVSMKIRRRKIYYSTYIELSRADKSKFKLKESE